MHIHVFENILDEKFVQFDTIINRNSTVIYNP